MHEAFASLEDNLTFSCNHSENGGTVLFQLVYGSFARAQGHKTIFKSLYQMVPNEAYQFMGVVRLLEHFRWRWIGLVVVDDDNGDQCLQIVIPMLTQHGICHAFILRLLRRSFVKEMAEQLLKQVQRYDILLDRKVNVCFVYGENPTLHFLKMLMFVAEAFALPPVRCGLLHPNGILKHCLWKQHGI